MRAHSATFFVLFLLFSGAALVTWRVINRQATAADGRSGGALEEAVAVEVAPIASGAIRDVRVLSGALEASTRFQVAAKIGGLIEELRVDLGDEIERGQVVAVIDDDEFIQAVAQARAELAVREAELAQARTELQRATRDFERIRRLHEGGVASDLEFNEITAQRDSQEAAVALAEARVRQAAAALELATIRLGYTTVRASWQGGPERAAVGMRYVDAGDTVSASGLIVGVVGLDPLKAIVSVTERDYARLVVGQAATLTTDALAGETFRAEVARIAPVFQEASRQARIELRVDNPRRLLRPGMFVRVRVVLREEQAHTIVPAAAIVQRSGRKVVFTVADDGRTVAEHPVETGIAQGERVQLISPHLSGRVVVLGQHLLEDGAAITITE
jgi:RND family efflux transporter MFP subunit